MTSKQPNIRQFLAVTARDEGGAIAIIFAFMLMVLFMTIGFAVDGGRAASNKMNAQHALDAAVLAASNVFIRRL